VPASRARCGSATFLAQTAHETAGYVIARENTRWTPEQMCALWPGRFKTRLDPRILACRGDEQRLANLAYGGRLGNVDADDGWAYRGGGFLQLTGRAAYHDAGSALGVDLEGMPELIEDAAISLNAALYYWTKLDINRFADRNYARAVGNAINRGNPFAKKEPIGAQTRARWLERAWKLFGDGKLHQFWLQRDVRLRAEAASTADKKVLALKLTAEERKACAKAILAWYRQIQAANKQAAAGSQKK
jgi:putative chitinase